MLMSNHRRATARDGDEQIELGNTEASFHRHIA